MRNKLSDIHNFIRTAKRSLHDISVIEAEAKKLKYRIYERFPSIPLTVVENTQPLSGAWEKRISSPQPDLCTKIGLQELSTVLAPLHIRPDGHRTYPSGGAKYPIEMYLVGTVGDFDSGVFHYQPQTHVLEYLWPFSGHAFDDIFGVTVQQSTKFALIFTAVWERTSVKYGDFGYQLVLLEAGHIGQNILLAATSAKVGARPFAGFDDELITKILDLDTTQEQPVYSIQLF